MAEKISSSKNFIDRIIGKAGETKEYGGIWLLLRGSLRCSLYGFFRLGYRFDKWNLTPIEWRPYALEVVKYVNGLSQKEKLDTVLEIGCGTGDILAGLKVKNKIGVDTEDEVIRFGKRLHPDIIFKKGSFFDVKGQDIDVLVTVNFIHGIAPETLLGYYNFLLKNNKIRYICVDSVDYKYHYDFDSFFKGLIFSAEKIYEKGGFKNQRKILVYKIIQ